MTLPTTGPISLGDVNVELGRASTAAINLGETAVRTLAGVPSGPISLSDLRGKSNNPVIASSSPTGIDAEIDTGDIHLTPRTQGYGLTGSASGGTSPYTYNWSFVSRSAPDSFTSALAGSDNSILNLTTQTYTHGSFQTYNEIWRLTVTDNVGQTGTVDITALVVIESSGP